MEALCDLAHLCAQRGSLAEADRLYRLAVDAGHDPSLSAWSALRSRTDPRWRDLPHYGLTAEGDLSGPWRFAPRRR
ncbi:hypothetical protein [Streptomyces sp. NPDC047071]|uniref:hypothetical protein n=1 Tax=Streptomyces sp. NPDC047071 TaxID=3154808 RepID=UPI00345295B4